MKYILLLLVFPFAAFAGESGYVLHGKTTVVYKNGEKVGDWPKGNRKPSSTKEAGTWAALLFEDDGIARCYYWSRNEETPDLQRAKNPPIFCVKH